MFNVNISLSNNNKICPQLLTNEILVVVTIDTTLLSGQKLVQSQQ